MASRLAAAGPLRTAVLPARSGASTTSRRPRSRPRSRPTWTRCDHAAGDRLRRPALRARGSPAARSRWRARSRSAWPRPIASPSTPLRARLRDVAQRAAGGGVRDRRRPRAPVRGGRGARPRRLQRLRERWGTAIRSELYGRPHTHEEEMSGCAAGRGGTSGCGARALQRRACRGSPRRASASCRRVLHVSVLPDLLGPGRARGRRSVLVPTTHDEPPLRFASTTRCSRARARSGFLTPAEEALVRSRFDLRGRPGRGRGHGRGYSAASGCRGLPAQVRDGGVPYALYAGRIDAGKGCAELDRPLRAVSRARGAPRT